MALYFLDTNVCIDLLRGKARGRHLPSYPQCRLSTVVEAELWTGANRAVDPATAKKTVRTFLDLFSVLPFDSVASETYGEIRSLLEKAGTPIGAMDLLIAAHARSAKAVLLTANLREFRRVPGLECFPWD